MFILRRQVRGNGIFPISAWGSKAEDHGIRDKRRRAGRRHSVLLRAGGTVTLFRKNVGGCRQRRHPLPTADPEGESQKLSADFYWRAGGSPVPAVTGEGGYEASSLCVRTGACQPGSVLRADGAENKSSVSSSWPTGGGATRGYPGRGPLPGHRWALRARDCRGAGASPAF